MKYYKNTQMGDNDADAKTIKEYFKKLLIALWEQAEGFSSKRPFGNSGWQWDVYVALIRDGMKVGTLDEDGYIETLDSKKADRAVLAIIENIFEESDNEQLTQDELNALKGGEMFKLLRKTQRELAESQRREAAAVEDITHECYTCRYAACAYCEPPCETCIEGNISYGGVKREDNWQWRGAQEDER